MTNIEQLKSEIENNNYDENIYTSSNENNENLIIERKRDYLKISTFQNNGWVRINIYHYDRETNSWLEEEVYEK